MSPQEEYIQTASGVRSLVEQQNKIMELIRSQSGNSLENIKTHRITRSSSSSNKTLGRILEMDEWRQFSKVLDLKLEEIFHAKI